MNEKDTNNEPVEYHDNHKPIGKSPAKAIAIVLGLVLVLFFAYWIYEKNIEKQAVGKGNLNLGDYNVNYTVKKNDPTKESNQKEPFTFEGKSPRNTKALEPLQVNFSIRNNSDIPIIASKIEFIEADMISKVSCSQGWDFSGGGFLSNPEIRTNNIYITNGNKIESSIYIVINNPGTYQFKLNPSVKAGDWISLNDYIFTVIVEDTTQSQTLRSNQSNLESVNKQLKSIDFNINDTESQIGYLDSQINYENSQINFYKNQIKFTQNQMKTYPEDAASYNKDIANYNKDIQSSYSAIGEMQNKIAVLRQKLGELTTQQNNLIKRKNEIEYSINNSQ